MDILLGTSNAGKLREVSVILAELPVRLLSTRDVGLDALDVEEPYETFSENAIHKARVYAQASGLITVADDSGIVVDALGGRPGVYSARYAQGGDRERYLKLLGELEGVPDEQRTARFVCIAAAVDLAHGREAAAEGVVGGRIAHAPGEVISGFGYDPIFIPDGCGVVLSALTMDEKNDLSHRGRAMRGLIPTLRQWLSLDS